MRVQIMLDPVNDQLLLRPSADGKGFAFPEGVLSEEPPPCRLEG